MMPFIEQIRKSSFTEKLVKVNSLHEKGFIKWDFHQGMIFGSNLKWWTKGKRKRPHEGIDICMYTDSDGKKHYLKKDTRIPVLYDGEIVKIEDDYLGKSIYIRHGINDHGKIFFTIYGHTLPLDDMTEGKKVQEGNIISMLSDAGKRKPFIPLHLHLTTALISESVNYKDLSWKTVSNPEKAKLINPLFFING